jgi:hypothetical protein
MTMMPKFDKGPWFFLGHDLNKADPKLLELLAKYKVKADFRQYRGRSAVFVNNPFRIDSIRQRLWGHRWAVHSDWLNEHPDWAGFDPRRKKIKL